MPESSLLILAAPPPSLWAYAHPALATLALVLCFLELRAGLLQREQRVRKRAAPPANLKRHVRLGPWAVALFMLSAVFGLLSAVFLRDWKPLATTHGWLGVSSATLFGGVWWLGRQVLSKKRHLANRHGLLGVTALFLGGLVALLGISLLP